MAYTTNNSANIPNGTSIKLARFGWILMACIVVASCTEKPTSTPVNDADIALNNKGVALMGRFDYRSAVNVFTTLTERVADNNDFRVNLAIALKNRQEANDAENALTQLKVVLDAQPNHLRANYVSGVLQLYLGRVDLAAKYFETVIALDPEDAYTHYYLGQCKLRSNDPSGALEHYQSAIKLDPYLRSAYYSAAQVLRRLGESDQANEQLSLFQRLEINPRARLAEFKYTRMGPMSLAQVLGTDSAPQEPSPLPSGSLFSHKGLTAIIEDTPSKQPSDLAFLNAANLTTVDFDNDGLQDLFISGEGPEQNRLFIGMPEKGEDKGFAAKITHPWSDISSVNAVAWGDVDNDGLVDAYLCRKGLNQLWLQKPAGDWTLNTASQEVSDGNNDCSDASFIDADHDGDLDILVTNRDAANNLLNNNRDGTFRSLADNLGGDEPSDTRHFVANDIDSDGDVDLIFVNETPPNKILINDRLWNYLPSTTSDELLNTPFISLASADLDADGQTELISIEADGTVKLWVLRGDNLWAASVVYKSTLASLNSIDLVPLDFNGNGSKELALLAPGAFEVITLKRHGDAWQSEQVAFEKYVGGTAIPVITSLAGNSLLAFGRLDNQTGLLEWKPGPGRFKFATAIFSGKHDAAETMRSNHSGIGTQISVRNGSQWSRDDTHKNSSMRGYSLQPVAIGLNGQQNADFIAIDWSDGVYQTELDIDNTAIHRVAEEQRQLGSCPVLFAWGGDKFDFVTDILGVAAQGFLVEPGKLLPPRPWERVTFPPGKLVSRGGSIIFKVTEPMEENSYIDSVTLESYDLPEDWQVIVDERMGTGAPEVTGETLFFRKSISPARAYNSKGKNVLKSILLHDQLAMPPGDIDRRYIGLLKSPESLTIEFDQAIDLDNGDTTNLPVLVAENWVELPYSQTHFAAWQAGRQYRSISLEARDEDGKWIMLYPEFGIPGGMPRTMSLPLSKLPVGSDALRFTWNREIYWDRVRIVYAEQAPEKMISQSVSPSLAKVSKSGFYERITHAQRRPEYVYQNRRSFGDVRYPTGFYTSLGEMTDLVSKPDDALAIIGPGEEVHIEFKANTPPPPGLKRWYVLDVKGWAKDSDNYTHQGDTVGPLPRSNPNSDDLIRDALHQKFNTRFQSGM